MLGNNLSQFGVDAGQLTSGLDTVSSSLAWMPTTGEFGSGFGDFEGHERLATRVGVHYTRSDENRQSQPDTEAIDNAQIRISRREHHLRARALRRGHRHQRRAVPHDGG